ncbi:MAG: NADH-quinone oxidoreductase subunit M [Myxococcales bacterium]|nr:NADH-quinone oxidoreductase subunit M [Myxococcales bacterium]
MLSLVTFLPLVGALLVAALPRSLSKNAALAVSLLVLAASLPLWFGYDPAGASFQFEENIPWIDGFGVSYHMGIDGVSLLLVLLTTVLTPIIVLAGFSGVEHGHRGYFALMLALEGAMIGTFCALDTFLFYVFWELVLIPMYFLIGIWGGQRRIYATVKFFIYTVVGSLLMLVAFIALYTLQARTGTPSTDLAALMQLKIPYTTQCWMFLCFALAFAIKVPMFPFHTWLPDAHVEAPTGGSVVLAGVMLKMGTYGFYRFAMPLFPDAVLKFGPWMIGLAVIGIVYGALVAMVQDDVKKLVAYSSVSHLGYCMLGLFALNAPGVSGSVFQMINHGISTGALFLLVGILYERRHTRMIADYGGLAKVVPKFAFVFMVVTFSSIGLPGLNGFVGEFLVLLGAFQYAPLPTSIAISGVVFGAAYMLWCFQRMVFGPLKNEANAQLADLSPREMAYLAPLLLAIVVLGVYPQPFLDRINPSVDRFVARFAEHFDETPYLHAGPVPSWVTAPTGPPDPSLPGHASGHAPPPAHSTHDANHHGANHHGAAHEPVAAPVPGIE